jgi:hypothetical protein
MTGFFLTCNLEHVMSFQKLEVGKYPIISTTAMATAPLTKVLISHISPHQWIFPSIAGPTTPKPQGLGHPALGVIPARGGVVEIVGIPYIDPDLPDCDPVTP